MTAPNPITPLGSTASFYDWFNSYNISAVGKLNSMYVYRVFAADGITLQGNTFTGGYTFGISSEINRGITFNGVIRFTNQVEFSNAVSVPNISQVFGGDYTTVSGLTLGSVVRITSDGGLTLAQADGKENAESIGVVIASNTSATTVAITGKISGSDLTNNILGSAGSFSTGCVYFLSDTVAGTVTLTEPSSNGRVSKPILIASGAQEATVIPFRGQYIELVGLSGASGSGFNTIILPITPVLGEAEVDFDLRPGSVVAVSATSTGNNEYTSESSNLIFYKAKSTDTPENMLGIVFGYAGNYSDSSTVYLFVNPIGTVTDFSLLDSWNISLKDSGVVYLDENGDPTNSVTSITKSTIGIASGNDFLFNPVKIGQTQSFGLSSLSSGSSQNKNLLINGSFSIWQRKDRGDVTGVTWSSNSAGGYFADRWCVVNGNPNGQTFEIIRKEFATNQIEVPAYPKYYFNMRGITVGSSGKFSVENRTENSRKYGGKDITFSFHARNMSGATAQYFTPYVKRLNNAAESPSFIYEDQISIISTSWQRYLVTFSVPNTLGTTFDAESYFAVGLRSDNSTTNTDFAQAMLEEGTSAGDIQDIDIDFEYEKCSYYYQRSYAPTDRTGIVTVWTSVPSVPVYNNSISNCSEIVITDLTNSKYEIPLKYRMKPSSFYSQTSANSIPGPTGELTNVKYYSPLNGVENDAYNATAKLNMRSTQGTISKNLTEMFNLFGLNSGNATIPPSSLYTTRKFFGGTLSPPLNLYPMPNADGSISSLTVSANQGFVLFDKIAFHYTIDNDLNQGF